MSVIRSKEGLEINTICYDKHGRIQAQGNQKEMLKLGEKYNYCVGIFIALRFIKNKIKY